MTEVLGGNMAFPIHNTGHGAPFDEGMTLRDYFAAKALSTILAQYDFTFFEDDKSEKEGDAFALIVARNAYEMANAMMIARFEGEQ
jgi:hypothetical protein